MIWLDPILNSDVSWICFRYVPDVVIWFDLICSLKFYFTVGYLVPDSN
jgi:hypothetical protein